MQKKFLSNLILLILLNLVVKPLAIFGIDVTVQNRVGAEEYGFYFSLLNFTLLFNVLLDVGINNFTTKYVAQHPTLMQKYLGKIAGLRLLLFVIYAVFTLVVAWTLGYEIATFPLLSLLIIQQFIISMIAYFRSFLAGLMLFKWDAFMSILDRFLLIVICGITLYSTANSSHFTIETFIVIQFICYLLSFIVGGILMLMYVGKRPINVSKPLSFLIIRKSYPYALLIVLMMFYTRLDSVMLERMLKDGAEQAGYYAQGFRLIDAFFMFAMLFSNLLLPIFARMIHTKEDVGQLFNLSARLLILGAVALAALCFWNSEVILSMIYTNDIQYTVVSFQLLILTFVAMCIVLIFGTYLTALGNMKTLNLIALLGLIINVIANLFLIPKNGVVGAALSTLLTQFAVAIAQMIIVYNVLKLNWNFKAVINTITFIMFQFVGLYYLSQCVSLSIQILYALLIVVLFKVINVKLFKQLLKGQ